MNYKIQYITNQSRLSAGSFESGEPATYTIHSTGNLFSTAQNERDNLQNNVGTTSFHSVVDDKEVIRCVPFTNRCWHAGDSTKKGGGNMSSLSLEICESGNRHQTLLNAIEVVAKDLKELGWGVERLRQHYDWSKKNCPRILRDSNLWEWFVSEVSKKMNDIPEWSKESIQWAKENKILCDDEHNLTLSEIKCLCYLHRYDKNVR